MLFLYVLNQTLQVEQGCVAFVAVIDLRVDAELVEHEHTTDTEQVFLLDTVFPVTAVELVGDLTVKFRVHIEVCIHQIELHQIFLFVHAGALGITAPVEAALVAGFLLLTGLSTYLWPLLALMELPFPLLIKDAALLFLGQLPRSAAALAVEVLYWAVVIWFFPLAAPLLPFTSLWLPTLPAVLLIYPGIETAFRIEEKLRERQKSE